MRVVVRAGTCGVMLQAVLLPVGDVRHAWQGAPHVASRERTCDVCTCAKMHGVAALTHHDWRVCTGSTKGSEIAWVHVAALPKTWRDSEYE
eukprot:8821930-Alexandrium_andersonii.AAC.1